MKTLRDPYVMHRRENRVQPLPVVGVTKSQIGLGWVLGCATSLFFVVAYKLIANAFFGG